MTFVGDVSLSRGAAAEITRRGSPWSASARGERQGPWIGNLEGALDDGTRTCTDPICLGISPTALDVLRGGPFAAMSVANNHAEDYGPRAATVDALRARGVVALEPGSVAEMTLAGRTWAIVPVDLSSPDGTELEVARLALTRARAQSPWVVAIPHWGLEGTAALAPGQAEAAEILRTWGATLVVGAGAHVPQPYTCDDAGAVYYGLGNHLFDQRPEETHTGAAVSCCPTRAGIDCTVGTTKRTRESTFPSAPEYSGPTCSIATPQAVDPAWQAHPWRDHVRAIQPMADGSWFALHDHWSDIDGEVGLRPYVFRMNADRSFTDVWRGSSLSRPLVAARLFTVAGQERLCAIHRGDSFLKPDPTTRTRVRTVYRWSGFGFRGVEEPEARAMCEAM